MLLENLHDQFKKGEITLIPHLYSTFRQPFVTRVTDKYGCTFDHAIGLYQISVLILYDEMVQDSLPNQKTLVISYLLQVAGDCWEDYTSYSKRVGSHSTFDHLLLVDRRKKMHGTLEDQALKDAMLKMNDPYRKYLETRYFQDPALARIPYVRNDEGGDVSRDLLHESIRQLLKINSEDGPT